MKKLLLICFAWIFLAGSPCYAGVVANGSFEDNPVTLVNWETFGLATIETNAFGVNPAAGSNQALLRTGDGNPASPVVSDLAAFLNIPVAAINAAAPNAFNGSGIKQTVNIDTNQKLTFSWNYLTSETLNPPTPNDFAFWSISGPQGQSAFFLGSTNAANLPFAGGGFTAQSGYNLASFTFTTPGDYVIGFGVVNAIDQFGPSALLVDNVSLAVPEPNALAGLGLFGAFVLQRRRQRRL